MGTEITPVVGEPFTLKPAIEGWHCLTCGAPLTFRQGRNIRDVLGL